MVSLSMRSLAALAYERGEEFDPALMPTPKLVEDLGVAGSAMALLSEPGSYERRRRRERERRLLERVPVVLRRRRRPGPDAADSRRAGLAALPPLDRHTPVRH
jgi:hypothetical protein